MRCAIDAQVDPVDTAETRRRKLKKAAGKIDYWQRERECSAKSHFKRRLKELRRLGIRLSELRRC